MLDTLSYMVNATSNQYLFSYFVYYTNTKKADALNKADQTKIDMLKISEFKDTLFF
jgi:hypothetical protein